MICSKYNLKIKGALCGDKAVRTVQTYRSDLIIPINVFH